MSEHQFKSIYNLGYGDAMYEHRKSRKITWPIAVTITIITAAVALWAGCVLTRAKAYEAGFDAGVREGTTNWGEWR